MGIIGIRNRTENWLTARELVPFYYDKMALRRLVKHLNSTDDSEPDEIEIELYWKGIRDRRSQYCTTEKKEAFETRLVEQYKHTFNRLRHQIEIFDGFRPLQKHNYIADDHESIQNLRDNLVNTEIDIVIQSRNYLYIGEAKEEEDLDSKGEYVLVHQLIRQRVFTKLLLDHEGRNLEIVQFVVLNHPPKRLQDQLRFAIQEEWLDKRNILTWDFLSTLRHAN